MAEAEALKPIRRVVAANDSNGKSKVVIDAPSTNTHPGVMGPGRGWTDLWVWEEAPLKLDDGVDYGNGSYSFPGPPNGGHLRVVQSRGPIKEGYDQSKDPYYIPFHEIRERSEPRTWDRGGDNAWASAMHKTETIDYGIALVGDRGLVLDDGELMMHAGDIVVQVGAWHQWVPAEDGMMAFDMIAATFEGGYPGKVYEVPTKSAANLKLPEGVKPARRIVTVDVDDKVSRLVSDSPAPDVVADPARPGFAHARLWVTDGTPAKIVTETLDTPRSLQPPHAGSICAVVTVPPDAAWQGKVGEQQVRAYFQSVGSPNASTYSAQAPHPYMQKVRAIDFCFVLEGEATLVLDTGSVTLKQGDAAILRGVNHAWSNQTNSPARLAIATHDAQ